MRSPLERKFEYFWFLCHIQFFYFFDEELKKKWLFKFLGLSVIYIIWKMFLVIFKHILYFFLMMVYFTYYRTTFQIILFFFALIFLETQIWRAITFPFFVNFSDWILFDLGLENICEYWIENVSCYRSILRGFHVSFCIVLNRTSVRVFFFLCTGFTLSFTSRRRRFILFYFFHPYI